MLNFKPDPVAFTVMGFDIRWYAILVCAGIVLASAIVLLRIPRRNISRDDALDVILFAVPMCIIGARAWYVFFERANYHSFFDVINTRAGGLAFHGGLLAGLLTVFIVCRVKHISFLDCMDTAVPCIALGQAIGRWGNFFNQEAYGTPTNLPWAITINGVQVHPTFLYESIWCLILFIVLSIVDRKKAFRGQTLSLYLILYSAERFLVEQLRTDSLLAGPEKLVRALKSAGLDPSGVEGVRHLGQLLIYPFRTAQAFSLGAILLGLLLYVILRAVRVRAPRPRMTSLEKEEKYAYAKLTFEPAPKDNRPLFAEKEETEESVPGNPPPPDREPAPVQKEPAPVRNSGEQAGEEGKEGAEG